MFKYASQVNTIGAYTMSKETKASANTESLPAAYAFTTAAIGTVMQYTFIHPIWSMKISAQSENPVKLTLSAKNLPVLFRGYWLHVARAFPVASTQIGVASKLKKEFTFNNEASESLAAGFVGGVLSGPIVTATDGIMTQQKLHGGSVFSNAKAIYAQRGISGFLTGLTSTAARNGGRAASYFSVFPLLYNYLLEKAQNSDQSFATSTLVANVGATAGAGFFATATTNPPDVIKTIQQNELLNSERPRTVTPRQAMAIVYQRKGIWGFFAGMQHRIASRSIEVFLMGQAIIWIPRFLDKLTGNSYVTGADTPRMGW